MSRFWEWTMYCCGITGIYIRHLTIVSWLSFAVTHLNSMHTRLGQGRDAFTKRLKSDRQQWDMRLTRGILNISKFQGNAHLSDFRDLWFNSFGGVLPLALGYNHISANCLHITLYQRGRVWWQCTGNHYLELYMTNSQSPSHQVPHIWARIKGLSLHLIRDEVDFLPEPVTCNVGLTDIFPCKEIWKYWCSFRHKIGPLL